MEYTAAMRAADGWGGVNDVIWRAHAVIVVYEGVPLWRRPTLAGDRVWYWGLPAGVAQVARARGIYSAVLVATCGYQVTPEAPVYEGRSVRRRVCLRTAPPAPPWATRHAHVWTDRGRDHE